MRRAGEVRTGATDRRLQRMERREAKYHGTAVSLFFNLGMSRFYLSPISTGNTRKALEQQGNKKVQQITIRFDAGLVDSYPTLKELLAARVHQQGRPQKVIAADLDLSPSDLSRKLSPTSTESDSRRNFDVNMMVRFIEQTGDKTPVDWLVEKFYHADELEVLRAKVAEYETGRAQPKKGRK